MFKCKKHFITVIELLLVIGIVSLITGIVGVNIRKLVQEQRFNAEVSLVVDTFRLAQDLMLIMQNDAHVKFETLKDNKGIRFWIELEKKPTNQWIREITKPKPLLTSIRKVIFNELNPTLQGQSTFGLLDIKFLSGGSVMSTGVIYLSSDSLERHICLLGYPKPIVSSAKQEDVALCTSGREVEHAERLTFAIQREINERKPADKKNAPTKTP